MDMEEYDYDFLGDVVEYVRGDLLSRGIPEEVVWVMLVEMYCSVVGFEVMDRINEIKGRWPKYYPWEARYNSIPKEVHEAYLGEVFKRDDWFGVSGEIGGLEDMVNRGGSEYKELTEDDFVSFIKDLDEREREQEEEERRRRDREDKALWDKYYKKYGLKWRG